MVETPSSDEKIRQFLAEAQAQILSGEHGETLSDFITQLSNWTVKAYAGDGMPSESVLARLYGNGARPKIRFGREPMDRLEENLLRLLENLGEANEEEALRVANGMMVLAGNVSPDLKARIMQLEFEWKNNPKHKHKPMPEHLYPGGSYTSGKGSKLPGVDSPEFKKSRKKREEELELSPERPENIRQPTQSTGLQSEPGDDRWGKK